MIYIPRTLNWHHDTTGEFSTVKTLMFNQRCRYCHAVTFFMNHEWLRKWPPGSTSVAVWEPSMAVFQGFKGRLVDSSLTAHYSSLVACYYSLRCSLAEKSFIALLSQAGDFKLSSHPQTFPKWCTPLNPKLIGFHWFPHYKWPQNEGLQPLNWTNYQPFPSSCDNRSLADFRMVNFISRCVKDWTRAHGRDCVGQSWLILDKDHGSTPVI